MKSNIIINEKAAPKKKISVLVVDDSAFMRKALKRMLNSDPVIRVVGDASDGLEALSKIEKLKPQVITLDVKMPGMDGLQTLERIMRENPTPVLMISSLTSEGGAITLEALQKGAVDFIDKSACHTTMDILEIGQSLVQKIKVIAGVDLKRISEIRPAPVNVRAIRPATRVRRLEGSPSHLVAIGASTGGPMSLEKVLTELPGDYPGAILIVQHMPIGFTRSLAERLNQQCKMNIKEAEEGDRIMPGHVYLAPGGYHLKIRRSSNDYYVALSKNPCDTQHRPSVDVLMKSVAQTWPGKMLGVVLTGMGQDGAEGVQFMKNSGTATIIVQDEASSVVFGMPRAAHLTGCVDRMVPLDLIAHEIMKLK